MAVQNNVVWKYEIGKVGKAPEPGCRIRMPQGAKLLLAAYQTSSFGVGLMLWALVNLMNPSAVYQVYSLPTGVAIPDPVLEAGVVLQYVSTIETGAKEICHIFVREEG